MANRSRWATQDTTTRGTPLGPVRLNQLDANTRWADELQRVEHLADGTHNALEVPWVVLHADGTTSYIRDATYGGTVTAAFGAGVYNISVASGLMTAPAHACLANVADSAIEAKPHTVNWYWHSATDVRVRIRELSSSLGSGNSWAAQDRDFDLALHLPAVEPTPSLLSATTLKKRRDFLTEAATDYNARAINTAQAWAGATKEHLADGTHNLARIARAAWWGRPSAGPSFTTTLGYGIKSVSYASLGVVTVEFDVPFASVDEIACFPEVQPATNNEMAIVNARGITTSTARLYTYAYDGSGWVRADRPLFLAVFGVV